MHDAGINNAEATFADPMDINMKAFADPMDKYMKVLLTSDPVVQGRGRVMLHFSEKIPSYVGSVLPQNGQLILDVRSIMHDAGINNAEATFADPMDIYMKALVTSDPVVRGRGALCCTSERIRPLFFGSILSKNCQLILDVR